MFPLALKQGLLFQTGVSIDSVSFQVPSKYRTTVKIPCRFFYEKNLGPSPSKIGDERPIIFPVGKIDFLLLLRDDEQWR